jgi:hypothetical protein
MERIWNALSRCFQQAERFGVIFAENTFSSPPPEISPEARIASFVPNQRLAVHCQDQRWLDASAVRFVTEAVLDAEITAISENPCAIRRHHSIATLAERVSCAQKAQVSKNSDGCTHPADVVCVAGSGA